VGIFAEVVLDDQVYEIGANRKNKDEYEIYPGEIAVSKHYLQSDDGDHTGVDDDGQGPKVRHVPLVVQF